MNDAARETPPWLQPTWASLARALARGRLAHALLIVGPRGAGKRWLARRLATRLACEAPQGEAACGSCRSCRQLSVGSHPNLTAITVDGHHGLVSGDGADEATPVPMWTPASDRRRQDIAIDALRDLTERLSLTAHYGATKVALIEPADALNTAGVNALLKTIEEPPANTHLLLVSERWRALPATLRSRCQLIRCPGPTPAQAQAWRATHQSDGPPAVSPARRRPASAGARELEDSAAGDWDRALAALHGGDRSPLALATGIPREDARGRIESWLQQAIAWQWALLAGAESQPPNGVGPDAVGQLIADLVEALRRLERNVSPAMVMESVMIRWTRAPADPDAIAPTH